MKNEQFLALIKESTMPMDLDGAIDLIGDLVKKKGDSTLLIKLGEISGKLASYNITKSNVILESIVIDIAIMMQKLCNNSSASIVSPLLSQLVDDKSVDLIYFKTMKDGWVDKKELLDEFYVYLTTKEDKSVPVARAYKSFINGELEKFMDNRNKIQLLEIKKYLEKLVKMKNEGDAEERKRMSNIKCVGRWLLKFLQEVPIS